MVAAEEDFREYDGKYYTYNSSSSAGPGPISGVGYRPYNWTHAALESASFMPTAAGAALFFVMAEGRTAHAAVSQVL